jgi:penicillin-binding protein 1C
MYSPEMFGELPNAAVRWGRERRHFLHRRLRWPAAARCHAVPTPAQVKAAWPPSDAELLDRHGEPLESLRIDMTARRLPWVALADISPSLGRACCRPKTSASWSTAASTSGRPARRPGTTCSAASRARRLDHHDAAGRPARSGSWQARAQRAQLGPEMGPGARRARAGGRLEQAADPGSLPEPGELSRRAAGRRRGRARPVRQGAVRPGPGESAILASLLRAPAARRSWFRGAPAPWRGTEACIDLREIEWQAEVALGRPANAPPGAAAGAASGAATADRPGPARAQHAGRRLQRFAQTLRRHLAELAERNVGDGAVVVLDNASGEILAYVGNTAAAKSMACRAAPGRVHAQAVPVRAGARARQLTAASLLDDTPVDIPTASAACTCRRTTTAATRAMPACAPAWPAR